MPGLEYSTGDRIGGYVVLSVLGHGAMSVVYKGFDEILNRDVAIKVLNPHLIDDADAIRRFEREADAISRINHKNIAQLFAFGRTPDNVPYLVMEYIDGPTFMDIINKRLEFTIAEIVNFFIQVAEGLQAAYMENIIHRDIKPQNLMLDYNNVVKILDFGLAKILWDESSKTVEGTILGTPYYMSPEMAAGRPTDHRGDIFSLGATFYHLLAQRPPFEADTPLGIMMKIATISPMPLYLSNPRVSHHLWEIIERTLEKDPNDRYQNYSDLINDLKQELLALRHKERDMVELPTAQVTTDSEPESVITESPTLGKEKGKEIVGEKISDAKRDYKSPKREPVITKVEVAPKRSWRMTAFLLGLFLLLMGLIALLFSFYQSLMLPSKETQTKPNIIIRLVNQIVAMTHKNKQTSGEDTVSEYERGLKTFTRMKSIYSAILLYNSKEHSEPKSLRELVEKNYLNPETIKDGWGNEIIYVNSFNRLIAPGSDGKADTSDDFVMGSDGKFTNLPEDFMLQTLERGEGISRR